MNIVIIDNENKKYQVFATYSAKIEDFINSNVTKINKKNETYIIVQTDIETQDLEKKGYEMESIFDRLTLEYNQNLGEDEKSLPLSAK